MVQKVSGRVSFPAPNDILFGRGKGCHQSAGNKKLRKLIIDCKDKYDSATAMEKFQITKEIVNIVEETSGRFLKDDGAGWVEVTPEDARRKVSHSFRSIRNDK